MSMPWQRNYSKYRVYFSQIYNKYQKRDDFKAYLELLLSLSAIIIFSVFALRPTLTTIATLSRELDTKEQALTKLNAKIESLNTAQAQLLKYEKEIAILKQAMPETAQPDSATRQLEGLAESNFVTVDSLTFEESPVVGDIAPNLLDPYVYGESGGHAIKFNLAVSARYEDLLTLLDDIENAQRKFSIESSTFFSSEDVDIVGLSMTGFIGYYYHEDSE